jgi:probable HAF family extracellular repeat protein
MSEDLMDIHRCYTPRNLILAAALTIGCASSAFVQQSALFVDLNSKEVTTLGPLGSHADGINDMGQVVGYNGQGHAFITGPNGVGKMTLAVC